MNHVHHQSSTNQTLNDNFTVPFIVFSTLALVFLYDVFNSFFGFYDEIIAFIGFLVILTTVLFKSTIRLFKEEIFTVLFLIGFILIGFLSNYFSYQKGYKTDLSAVLGDFISFIKAYLVYFGIRFSVSKKSSEKALRKISYLSEWIFYILIVFLLADLIFKIYPQYQRFGLRSFQLFFIHTSRYGFAFAFIFLVLFPKYYMKNNLFLVFILLLGALSLRVKYFGFFIFSVFFLYNTHILKRVSKKYFIAIILFFIFVLGLIFKDQIAMYFYPDRLADGWSRAVLLYYSFVIGNDFFPFGTGFGTYASYFSGKYYSWVYPLYNIDDVYGISKQYWEYISDQFWPMVLGEFGYFGLLFYLGIVYQLFKLFFKQIKKGAYSINYRYIPLLGLILLLIDSSSDAIFNQNRAVALFILFALSVNLQTIAKRNV